VTTSPLASRRLWSEAAGAAIGDRAAEVRSQAKKIDRDGEPEAVHDMRTATRRLRTAIQLYRDIAPPHDRRRIEAELRRVGRRLGLVRDLDVLVEALADVAQQDSRPGLDVGLEPLRKAWLKERDREAGKLTAELHRRRFDRAMNLAATLARRPDRHESEQSDPVVIRVGHRVPHLVLGSFGELLTYELDPRTADTTTIHEMRMKAKELRYTLETFEQALAQPGALIRQVTALQDEAGEMHDAVVAGDRARKFVEGASLSSGERQAIEAFATAQARRADACRAAVARALSAVRGRAFRLALDDAIMAGLRTAERLE
jgi:CHAD domain-containing protein